MFRRAARHSRFVRFLRISVPAGVMLIAGGIAFATYIKPMFGRLPIDPGKVVLSGTKITMEQPRLAGFTHDGRPYELQAQAAAQDITKPNLIELKGINARLQMQNKAVVELNAANGLYDRNADVLKLADSIVLTTSTGYSGRLREATVQIQKGIITSESPVEVNLMRGRVNANRLEISENGARVLFDRGVETVLLERTEPRATAKANTP